jgi:hypothetical protein
MASALVLRYRSAPSAVTMAKVRIGLRQAGGEHFSGKLDEVRIYNRALSVAEILALKDY